MTELMLAKQTEQGELVSRSMPEGLVASYVSGGVSEGPAGVADLEARRGAPFITGEGAIAPFEPGTLITPVIPLEEPKQSYFNRAMSTKRGKMLVAAAGAVTLWSAHAVAKPATAEGSLGLFGPKVNTVSEANKYLDMRLNEDCSPVKDSIGDAIGIRTKEGQDTWITPENVEIIGKTRASNKVWKTSTGASGCAAIPTPNRHGSSVAFTYAVKSIPNTKEARAKTKLITKGKFKGWRQLLTIKGRGECGLQAISRTLPPKPTKGNRMRPDYEVDSSKRTAALVAVAEAEARSGASQHITITCPDGSKFISNQQATSQADALAGAVNNTSRPRTIIVRRADIEGDNSFAAVEAVIRRRADGIIAAAKASAKTDITQEVIANCAASPGVPPEATPTPVPPQPPSMKVILKPWEHILAGGQNQACLSATPVNVITGASIYTDRRDVLSFSATTRPDPFTKPDIWCATGTAAQVTQDQWANVYGVASDGVKSSNPELEHPQYPGNPHVRSGRFLTQIVARN